MSSLFDSSDPENQPLLDICNKAKRIAVLTGAGISAESGLDTFRGHGGIWGRFKPEELANMDAFLRNPKRVWEWYQYRRDVLNSAKPNPGHLALAVWERLCPDFSLVTQNVDGLHYAAGSKNVIELHGNLKVNRCQRCGKESDTDEIRFEGKVPKCACGGMLRPGVVWFGEMLPETAIQAAYSATQVRELFLAIGTSAVVYPAAALPEVARQSGAVVVEINPEPTPITHWVDYSLSGNAGDVLPQLVEAIKAYSNFQ